MGTPVTQNDIIKMLTGMYEYNEMVRMAMQIQKHGIAQESMNHANWIAEQEAQESREAVAVVVRNSAGQIHLTDAIGNPFDISKYIGQSFYTAPPTIQQLIGEIADLKDCHQNLLESDNSNIQQLIDEIESCPYTDETSIILDKWRTK